MSAKPVSLRIDSATRADLDYLIECSGLKEAQVIRQAVKRVADQARRSEAVPQAAANRLARLVVSSTAPKPARKKR